MKKLRVLSLFDGISCGQVALERAGIKVENYYASEIDKYAIQVTQNNYPNTTQLGDVTKWQEWDIDWSSIDLLIGGSPCQGFSFAGKQLNFNDERSKLFFAYVDILNNIKKHNPNVKFLLENVKMKKEYENVITNCLSVEPVLINSSLVSAQNRNRLYWTNWKFDIPRDCKNTIIIGDIKQNTFDIDDNFWLSARALNGVINSSYTQQKNSIVWINQKCPTLRARDYKGAKIILEQNGKYRYLTPLEYERLQTLPDNYTQGISNTQRYKCIGNGWTVDVIAHIFNNLMY